MFLQIENLWRHVISEKLYMVILDMEAFSGRYNRNGIYFHHADLSSMTVTVNGNNIYDISTDFPHKYAKCWRSWVWTVNTHQHLTHLMRNTKFSYQILSVIQQTVLCQ